MSALFATPPKPMPDSPDAYVDYLMSYDLAQGAAAIGQRIGKPAASRAVGAAVGRNPLSIVVAQAVMMERQSQGSELAVRAQKIRRAADQRVASRVLAHQHPHPQRPQDRFEQRVDRLPGRGHEIVVVVDHVELEQHRHHELDDHQRDNDRNQIADNVDQREKQHRPYPRSG